MKAPLVAPFKWVVVIELDEDLVADGLDLNDVALEDALSRAFPLARKSGISVRVVKAPAQLRIAKTQGYVAKRKVTK